MSTPPNPTTTDIVNAFMSDLEITHGAGHGGYSFACDGADYIVVIDESFYADGDPTRHEVRATVWTGDDDPDVGVGGQEIATLRFLVDVIA